MEGIVFKIKRKSKNMNLHKVEQLSGIDKTMISRFENQKLTLTQNQIDLLFSTIGEESCTNFEQKQALLEYVHQIYLDFIQENKFKYTYQEYIAQGWQNIHSEEYFVYLIGLLIYGCEDKFAQNTLLLFDLIKLLKDYEHYIPIPFQSIFFCIAGLYYTRQVDWNHSLKLFHKAKVVATNDLTHAFSLYHLGKHRSYSCDLLDALDLLNQAKRLFDQHFYIKNALYCQIEIGYVYMKLGLYQKAEEIFVDCIQLNNQYSINLSVTNKIYSLLVYMYLNAKRYEKLNKLCAYMIKYRVYEFLAYFCLGVSSFYENDWNKAKQYFTVAKKYKKTDEECCIDKMVIRAYRLVMNGRDFIEYEKKFLKIYQYSLDKNDMFLQMFILEVLVDLAKRENKTTELIKYYSLLHDKLKERH